MLLTSCGGEEKVESGLQGGEEYDIVDTRLFFLLLLSALPSAGLLVEHLEF